VEIILCTPSDRVFVFVCFWTFFFFFVDRVVLGQLFLALPLALSWSLFVFISLPSIPIFSATLSSRACPPQSCGILILSTRFSSHLRGSGLFYAEGSFQKTGFLLVFCRCCPPVFFFCAAFLRRAWHFVSLFSPSYVRRLLFR